MAQAVEHMSLDLRLMSLSPMVGVELALKKKPENKKQNKKTVHVMRAFQSL